MVLLITNPSIPLLTLRRATSCSSSSLRSGAILTNRGNFHLLVREAQMRLDHAVARLDHLHEQILEQRHDAANDANRACWGC